MRGIFCIIFEKCELGIDVRLSLSPLLSKQKKKKFVSIASNQGKGKTKKCLKVCLFVANLPSSVLRIKKGKGKARRKKKIIITTIFHFEDLWKIKFSTLPKII